MSVAYVFSETLERTGPDDPGVMVRCSGRVIDTAGQAHSVESIGYPDGTVVRVGDVVLDLVTADRLLMLLRVLVPPQP